MKQENSCLLPGLLKEILVFATIAALFIPEKAGTNIPVPSMLTAGTLTWHSSWPLHYVLPLQGLMVLELLTVMAPKRCSDETSLDKLPRQFNPPVSVCLNTLLVVI